MVLGRIESVKLSNKKFKPGKQLTPARFRPPSSVKLKKLLRECFNSKNKGLKNIVVVSEKIKDSLRRESDRTERLLDRVSMDRLWINNLKVHSIIG